MLRPFAGDERYGRDRPAHGASFGAGIVQVVCIRRPARKRLNDTYNDVKVSIHGKTAVLTAQRSWLWEDTREPKRARITILSIKHNAAAKRKGKCPWLAARVLPPP